MNNVCDIDRLLYELYVLTGGEATTSPLFLGGDYRGS